ncbi:ASKHA domain-containing protein [Clostridium grantii]|uniref:Uncharacterized 2Fe-2 and 4Fe-4S clusters-containing protein, contains DUF4445 domain n=1 Tax=Clostridium grantii DSM 8605 TaxID=1121316 RepID=A0A1M5T3R6_9CLOT|nr:ASKHA domain-containing protein [Clostridium grantii]SHH45348.1 Uncharacterized 2Fe-2 and 4Fe-4S clusters-containing protein, contains DUF4445 domain [Clostridium grantii DSM 8605]
MSLEAKIILEDNETIIQLNPGESLLKNLTNNNFKLESPCGGKGSCGKCKIRILQGQVIPSSQDKIYFSEDELIKGYRLACTCYPEECVIIEVEKNFSCNYEIITTNKIQKISKDNLRVNIYEVKINEEILEEINNITSYINKTLQLQLNYSLDSLEKLAFLLKDDITIIDKIYIKTMEAKVIDVSTKPIDSYGIAIDIGTTTLAISLIDMKTGNIINNYSSINPQQKYGYDVITRIQYASEDEKNLKEMSKLISSALEESINKLLSMSNIDKLLLDCITIAGNTTMIQLLLGLDSFSISLAPFTMITNQIIDLSYAEVFKTHNLKAKIFLLPSVSAYVGGDITSGIYTTDMGHKDFISILLDIGTNGEMVIGNKDKLMSASTAAGPAFEGAKIKYGVGGVKGAIEAIKIEGNKVLVKTIANEPPLGICGTGVVDIVSELLDNKIIDETGYLNEEYLNEDKEYFITNKEDKTNIGFTQKDIREVQLAKAAILAGIEVLIQSYQCSYEDIDKIYLSGGFGTKLHFEQAINIGLLPKELKEKIVPIGNSSLDGAIKFLLNKDASNELENIIRKTDYIELSLNQDFNNKFIDNMYF